MLSNLLQVVVQQLNFIERSNSTAPHYDQDSSSMMAGMGYFFNLRLLDDTLFCFRILLFGVQSHFFPGRKLGSGAVDNMGSTQELWQAFFANPVDWWDNRKNKVLD